MLQNRYRILKTLGKGGMGAVYLAEDERLQGKFWAIKEMLDFFTDPAERAQAIEHFQLEASLLARLDHPNLPEVADYFSEGGKHYLVMEFIEGETLASRLKKVNGPLPETQVLEWARQLCDVLDYLHTYKPSSVKDVQPVIFRDMKPDNVMINPRNEVKLIDFGIARFFKKKKSQDTIVIGTPGYSPPEQYGKGQTDARSDIYALGVTLHQLLTGHDPANHPFQFDPPSSLNPKLSKGLDQFILKAIQHDPDDRYQSAAEMKNALLEAIAGGICPNCGGLVRLGGKFCPNCGRPFSGTLRYMPVMILSTNKLDFGELRRKKVYTSKFTIANGGSGELSGTIHASPSWIKTSRDAFTGNKVTVKVRLDATNFADGQKYQGNIDVRSNGGNGKVEVVASLPAKQPPLVSVNPALSSTPPVFSLSKGDLKMKAARGGIIGVLGGSIGYFLAKALVSDPNVSQMMSRYLGDPSLALGSENSIGFLGLGLIGLLISLLLNLGRGVIHKSFLVSLLSPIYAALCGALGGIISGLLLEKVLLNATIVNNELVNSLIIYAIVYAIIGAYVGLGLELGEDSTAKERLLSSLLLGALSGAIGGLFFPIISNGNLTVLRYLISYGVFGILMGLYVFK